MTKDTEDIIVVRAKSDIDPRPCNFFTWQHLIKYARVIPYPARVSKLEGGTFYEGKVKGERAVRIELDLETGITLSYSGKEWKETTSVAVIVPFKEAEQIAEGILRTIRRNTKK